MKNQGGRPLSRFTCGMFLRQQMLGGLQWDFHHAAAESAGLWADDESEADWLDGFWLWARGA